MLPFWTERHVGYNIFLNVLYQLFLIIMNCKLFTLPCNIKIYLKDKQTVNELRHAY